MCKIIKFLRKKDYEFLKELGKGACGKTVLLNDPTINEKFVCKKFEPYSERNRDNLFKYFLQEIKLLHLINHINIVRVFTYYIYSDMYIGYFLMEYIDGIDIGEYLEKYPENINEIFLQVITGFKYLEKNKILHRDIRPLNIMVTENGIVKIIDFGFGKKINHQDDFDKSISLNWWCELPDEFNDKNYNFTTEVYFIGKLFEKIIKENRIETFNYSEILNKMCQKIVNNRIKTFFVINQEILNNRFIEIDFNENDVIYYRKFSSALFNSISKIEIKAKYYDDIEKVQNNIENIYKKIMLEKYIPNNFLLIGCFIDGNYWYYTNILPIEVIDIKNFITLLQSCSTEKKNVILSNIYTKLDSIDRFPDFDPWGDETPF